MAKAKEINKHAWQQPNEWSMACPRTISCASGTPSLQYFLCCMFSTHYIHTRSDITALTRSDMTSHGLYGSDISVRACVSNCLRIYLSVCLSMHVCVCLSIYTHTHKHTHTPLLAAADLIATRGRTLQALARATKHIIG